MSIRNKVTLIGNIGKDPEVRNLDSGQKVANFTLATTEKWKDKEGNPQQETQWHNLVLWKPYSEIAEKYLKKGDSITIEGKITYRDYEVDGQKKYITEIVVKDLVMNGKKSENGKKEQSDVTDDLPF